MLCRLLVGVTLYGFLGARSAPTSAPIVTLSYGQFQGVVNGTATSFLGIPYAQPPLGPLRFAPPHTPQSVAGVQQATSYGAACPQQASHVANVLPFPINERAPSNVSEDCLFVNVVKPTSISTDEKLPVIFWIYGGGFETGDTSLSDGTPLVERSLVLNEPVIFVSANYRMNAFGFLASEEVKSARSTNIGLRDQRFAIEWVNQHIAEFGGDPTKVIIWGESAGALSVGLHLVMFNGNTDGLFRGAFMESGSPYALRDVSAGQQYYDQLVEYTGCSGESDTLDCLRYVSFDSLMDAIKMTPNIYNYTSLNLAWQPRLDDDIFVRNPEHSIEMGLWAQVPTVSGDCDDEGTVFSLGSTNITTDSEFVEYVQRNYIPVASASQIAAVAEAYPADPAQGSPFGTGDANNLTSQYKRLAAFQGDWEFQAPRRLFQRTVSSQHDTWGFLYKRDKSTPYLGSYHSTDLVEFFDVSDYIGADALINFAYYLNPNAPTNLPANVSYLSGIQWPKWEAGSPQLLTFIEPAPSLSLTEDTYRATGMSLISELSLKFP
ncbi:sterol esterase [Fomitopsis serialis]|uniref:sterol esterase n=1 Tax=Fomitopsis serialis TaxID=139415 RepID=UPI002008B7C7|nr:sterol esterase [Neoantrodia serialis]KAH9918278.1 sterol esterase [Neoantrodia serialis]